MLSIFIDPERTPLLNALLTAADGNTRLVERAISEVCIATKKPYADYDMALARVGYLKRQQNPSLG